ncbi:MAG: type IV secretion system protein VirB6 [Desulforhopalus sp.]|jgi:type IV secretion system protein VirB6
MFSFADFFMQIDTKLDAFFLSHIAEVMAYIAPVIYSCSIILIIGVGLGLLFGKFSVAPVPLIMATLTITLVTLIATNLGIYNTYVADVFRALPDEMISLVSPLAGASGVGAILDSFAVEIEKSVTIMWSSATGMWSGLKLAIVAIIVCLVFIVFAIGIVLAMVIAKVVLVILITVGPIFIACLLLPQTKDFFAKWLSYVIQFTVLSVLIGAILSLISDMILASLVDLTAVAGTISLTALVGPFTTMGITCYVFTQLPNMASSLTGGIGMGVGSFVGSAIDKGASGLSKPVTGTAGRYVGEQLEGRKANRIKTIQRKAADRATLKAAAKK